MTSTTGATERNQEFANLLADYREAIADIERDPNGDVPRMLANRLAAIDEQIASIRLNHVADIATKIEILSADGADIDSETAKRIIEDLRWSAGIPTDEPSELFQPDVWLFAWEKHGGGWIVQGDEAKLICSPSNKWLASHLRRLKEANGQKAVEREIITADANRLMAEAGASA